MKKNRRSLLLLSLAGCVAFIGRPWPALAEDASPSSPSSPVRIAALQNQEKDEALRPASEAASPEASPVLCQYLVTVADDFVVEVYHNGRRVPDAQRELLLERFGATAEKISVPVRDGDWLVFHVVQDRLRWGGNKYFAVAGCLAENQFGFVSDPASAAWSVCDDPARVRDFIRHRNAGRNNRALAIESPWEEGDGHMKEFAGQDYAGKSLWGHEPSTWIKFVAGPSSTPEPNEAAAESGESGARPTESAPSAPTEAAPFAPRKWPVQILSATFGAAGKNADVTAKVKEHVETFHRPFSVNRNDLGVDPIPYRNKSLDIVYMKDGIRREQHRRAHERVLPESFYGPQDAGELRSWLLESRWFGEPLEIQFHADQTFTSPGMLGTHRWEATGPKSLRFTRADDRTEDYVFDFTWSSFSEVGNGRNVFRLQE